MTFLTFTAAEYCSEYFWHSSILLCFTSISDTSICKHSLEKQQWEFYPIPPHAQELRDTHATQHCTSQYFTPSMRPWLMDKQRTSRIRLLSDLPLVRLSKWKWESCRADLVSFMTPTPDENRARNHWLLTPEQKPYNAHLPIRYNKDSVYHLWPCLLIQQA